MTSHLNLTVAVLGPQGTFTEEAARRYFGPAAEVFLFDSVEDVFEAVEQKKVNFAVVPVENSTEGSVTRTLDRFVEHVGGSPKMDSVQVIAEIMLRVRHHLLSRCSSIEEIREVFAHQQALAQCRKWLKERLSSARAISVSSNAEGARLAALTPFSAAIAGEKTAELYQLLILNSNIEDEPNNTTRFWILGHERPMASGEDKTSLLITVSNRPGILYQALEPFARLGIDLVKIESRPSKKSSWDYVFFIDINGHSEKPDVVQALQELEARVSQVHVLGSYPCIYPPKNIATEWRIGS